MPTGRGEISRSEPGRLGEQLAGKVWLAQNKAEWPVAILTSESKVIGHMTLNRDAVVWEYEITPVRRVGIVTPEPVLTDYPDSR